MKISDLKKKKEHPLTCSFCGRTMHDGVEIVMGPRGASICTECASIALSVANEDNMEACQHLNAQSDLAAHQKESGAKKNILLDNIPTPREIVKQLDEYVIGQDEVKRTLAVAVYNHYTRIKEKIEKGKNGNTQTCDCVDLEDVEIEKSNILMIGPTGCGKTLLAKTIAKILNVPFAIADATTLTEAGYVGEDVENVVRYLYNNANGDVKKTEMGICWIDECDKIASKTQNVSITRDVSGEGVQQALLKIIEGTTCRFPPAGGRKHPEQPLVEIDTSNILFICGGAFVGLDEIVKQRVEKASGARSIGFSMGNEDKEKPSDKERVRPEDLVSFGLIPELVGRLPIVAEMKELTEDELVKVLVEPKNCLTKQYRKLLMKNGVDLKYSDGALREMARLAIERKTGARGLRAEMEGIMRDIMFEAPENQEKGKEILVTEQMVHNAA